jgi:dTDP-4-dehydrorhamnose reductase
MKILLLGAQGQVGWQLRRSLAVVGEVTALARGSEPLSGDLSQPQALARTVQQVAPQLIVNAAAYTAVDKAESEREQAFAINADACAVLAREAERLGAWLIHYSTDYVFDGRGERPWTEADATSPVNAYGASKLAGEEAIARETSSHVILRTSWVYDTWGQNFLKSILRAAAQRESLNVVADQWGAPTRASLIADVTAHVAHRLKGDPKADALAGIHHLAAAGETSWHGYAQLAIAHAIECGMPLKVTPERVHAIPASQYPTAAARPSNSRMDTTRLRRSFGLALPAWQDGVRACVAELAALTPRI